MSFAHQLGSISLGESTQAVAAVAAAAAATFAFVQTRLTARELRDAGAERQAESEASAQRMKGLERQLGALSEITQATKDTARAQLQPVVLLHALGGPVAGESAGSVEFRCYLSNEGPGTAYNVEFRVEVGRRAFSFAGGAIYRSMRSGEFIPQLEHGSSQPVPSQVLRIPVRESDLPEDWRDLPLTYSTCFASAYAERFETRNSAVATEPMELRAIPTGASWPRSEAPPQ